jgi:hypothetical protein
VVKTITIKINKKSENVEAIIKKLIRLYEDEIESFSITDKNEKI